jgi:UDP-N-acetyl-2-amino-2-deoxyglucuronate dehydrogenase
VAWNAEIAWPLGDSPGPIQPPASESMPSGDNVKGRRAMKGNGRKDRALNFGIVGCGRIASRHADAIWARGDSRLVAVCDSDAARAARMASQYSCESHSDYAEMLSRDDLDVVCICTPSGMHASQGIEAARAGKHVVVEKPMALTLEDADALRRACDEAGVKLTVVLQNRYNAAMRRLREAADAGKMGKLLLATATVRWYRPQEYYSGDNWHGTWAMDGGALMNQAIHHIDAMQWMMGEAESVFAYTGTLAHEMEAEDTGIGVVRFRSGSLGSVEGSTITYPANIEGSLALFAQRGSVKIGGNSLDRIDFWKVEGELEHEREILRRQELDPPPSRYLSHSLVLDDMVRAIREDGAPATDGVEGRKSLALVLAFYRSARESREVKVSEIEPMAIAAPGLRVDAAQGATVPAEESR